MIDATRERWMATVSRTGLANAELAWITLGSCYAFGPRDYHHLGHVMSCLHLLDEHVEFAKRIDTIELALWFHDAVYIAGRKDNEAMSAELLKMVATHGGLDGECIELACGLVMATRHTGDPLFGDEALIADIDLASLAIPADEYQQTASAVRREFDVFSDEEYASGRRAFLEGMLARERIYETNVFFKRCEESARENMMRELASLSSGG